MAIEIDKFTYARSLQDVLLRKDNGNPLQGYIYTWADTSPGRTVEKPLYKYNGMPGNPSYEPLEWPVAVVNGTPVDEVGTPVMLFYYPYDVDDASKVEKYFIEVRDTSDALQFTRENWPIVAGGGESENTIDVNYITNGQFLAHHTLPEDSTHDAGEIRAAITEVAYGGWTYERTSATLSSGKDYVEFEPQEYITDPEANPRFFCKVRSTDNSGSEGFKQLRVKFRDVNMFASDVDKFTFAFSAESNIGDVDVSLYLLKNYGTGGSPSTVPRGSKIDGSTFTVTTSMDKYYVTFDFGDNSGKSIPALDDFIQIGIDFPVAESFNIDITDVILTPNAVSDPVFPYTTNQEVMYSAVAGELPVPAEDGSNLYLPILLGPNGFIYDDNVVGSLEELTYTPSDWSTLPLLDADGSGYETSGYSSLGIPYSRLQSKYYDSTLKAPIYGTGPNYFISSIPNSDEKILLTNNKFGTATACAAGTTTFTFQQVHAGVADGFYIRPYMVGSDTFYIENEKVGVTTASNASTSTFTVSEISPFDAPRRISSFTAVDASALAGATGKYFEFESYDGTVAKPYFVWYSITTETKPVPAGSPTEIKVVLDSGDTKEIVAQKTVAALLGGEVTLVTCLIASSITSGQYWTAEAQSTSYYIWYDIDNAGTADPAPGGTGIKVEILSTDTAAQVADKTREAINSRFFAVPDLRGMFVRGRDNSRGLDIDAALRYSFVPGLLGDKLGTYQFDMLIYHDHPQKTHHVTTSGGTPNNAYEPGGGSDALNPTGGNESRPYNSYIQYAIRY